MTESAAPPPLVRRVRLSAEISAEGRAAMGLAAEIAQALEAHLDAVFFEDEDVLALARLPVAREVLRTTGAGRPLDAAQIERDMRATAMAARREVEAVSVRARLDWAFSVSRGDVAQAFASEARPGDLIVLPPPAIGVRHHGTVTEALRRAAVEGGADVMLVRAARPAGAARRHRPILVVEEDEPGAAVSDLARRLARRSGAPVRHLAAGGRSLGDMAAEVRALAPRLMVMSAGLALQAGEPDLARLTAGAACSVIFVGGAG